MLKAAMLHTAFACILVAIFYPVENRFESGEVNLANVFVIGIIIFIFVLILISKVKHKNSKCSCCPYSQICGK